MKLKTRKPILISAAVVTTDKNRFKVFAYSGGELPVDGYDVPVIVDLAGLELAEPIQLLIDHDNSVETTLGVVDVVQNNGRTLSIEGLVTGQSVTAKNVINQAKAGHKWQSSIGVWVLEAEDIAEGDSVKVNGQTFVGPVIVARRALLRETSVLPIGADTTTSVNLAARVAGFLKGAAAMSFEDWLASLGIDATALTPEGQDALMKMYSAATGGDASSSATESDSSADVPVSEDDPTISAEDPMLPEDQKPASAAARRLDVRAAIRKQAAAELTRVAKIQAKTKGFPEIAAAAVQSNWSLDKVDLEVLKKRNLQASTRPTSFRSAEGKAENTPQVLEAALGMARGIKSTEKDYKDEVLQAAHTQYRRGISLQQLLLASAAHNGMAVRAGDRVHSGNLREVLASACGSGRFGDIQASGGFSTVNTTGILSNIANKDILQGYMEEEQSWREIAQVKSVSDLKVNTSYRMLDDMEYEQIGAGGEIKHGGVNEESYTRQAKTYAKMFALTRTNIINDDLGAFDDLRNRIGRGGAKKLNRVFWTSWLANSSFFTSGRGNYITGATTTLLTDMVGLQLALDAFDALRTPSADGSKVPGGLVGGSPTILLTPGGAIASKAEQIYKNSNLGSGTANADANIFSGRYRPVKSVFLNDSTISGYSATAWYLLRDPSAAAGIVVSFLNGQESPTVDSADADFNTLGIQFRGYHDFGCDLAEYLCGVKSKGAA